ncbi:MAG TPA: cytochrome b/b6 domain-containing protein [Nocardioides sp.]|nr:cytochrome b/b6 domain-containing protein [Nocardioides sp.]
MTARNGPDGYGWVTKSLHWVTVLALAAQLAVGYVMDADDSGGGRGRGRGGGSGHGRGRGGEDSAYLDDPGTLLTAHVVLGVLIILLAVLRLVWRRATSLPPWSEHLSERQRQLSHWTERVLMWLLLLVPATGLVLVAAGDDDVLPLHVASHVALYVAVAAHLVVNLRPRILARML